MSATDTADLTVNRTDAQWREELTQCGQVFWKIFQERKQAEPAGDLMSLLAHGKDTHGFDPYEMLGNVILLIVGGNDTTRNSMTASVLGLNKWPEEYDKLRADHSLIPSMVSEVIRWQTPLAYMRRTALEDVELHGKTIKTGDQIAMWYVSGNRDETMIEHPDRFWIDRPNARRHLSFGFGVHRCMGNRVGEMQLRILWEEILKRFSRVEVTGDPVLTHSNFVKGYTSLPVKLHAL